MTDRDVDVATLREALDAIDAEEPPVLELAEQLADATDRSVAHAQREAYDALDAGVLVEEGDGWGGVALAETYREGEGDDTPETSNTGERKAEKPETPDKTPTPDADKPASNNAKRAFADAVEYFHRQLDTDLPEEAEHDTPREYYREARGLEPDTVDDKLLGYAPADDVGLLDYLMRRGHDREAILGTGLFWSDGLDPIWSGRYVFPYFDADGRPAYAISRRLEPAHLDDGAGKYAPDDEPAKYHKIPDREHTVVEEPIYGVASLEPGEPVVITEGIADAIAAHEAGYPALSPVTTQFKHEHREALAGILRERDVGRVVVVQDAEPPSVEEKDVDDVEAIGDALAITQYGEGLRGALDTAAYLRERDVEAYLAELPRPGLEKVDLDDYIHGWGDTWSLGPLLASAVPPEQHRAHEARRTDAPSTGDTGGEADPTPHREDADGNNGGRGRSKLWDLDITDVVGESVGYRGTNPLGHHGNSENYFVVSQDGGETIAYDHKYKVAYAPLTYLLCEAGERRDDDPTGALDDEEVLAAWVHAKEQRYVPDDDPIPYRALRGLALKEGLVEADDLVRRDSDTGDVVDDPEDHDGSTYLALPDADTYRRALQAVRDRYGVEPGRELGDRPDGDGEDYRTDPRELEATVDPRRAWDAAGRITPEDLDSDALEASADGEAFACPECGDTVDVVRAVAIDSGLVEACEHTLEDDYPEAYRRAREQYDAPLPEYYTTSDAIAEFDAVLDVIGEVSFFDLEVGALESDTTERGDEVGGDAVRALNPAWRESESEASVLVFESGVVWDADTERTLDGLRFAALDSGLIDYPGEPLQGSAFTEAYRRLREEYGAPVPRWDPAHDGDRDVTPQLPPSDDLVEATEPPGVDTDELEAAREDVEDLLGEATADADEPTVVRALPATGKTTAAVKTARDRPVSYLAPRKQLQEQALDKADRWGVDAQVLPVFSEERVRDEVLDAAVSHVRELGKSRLRDRSAIVAAAFDGLGDDGDGDEAGPDLGDIFVEEEDDEDAVELDRPTCQTAEGDHGVAWALAVHVARRLGYTPQEIHTQARGLFGAELPCSVGEGCGYTHGWDAVGDPDAPPDLLVGSYVHGHVESVRTEYTRAPDGSVTRATRAVVIDEYPGEAFVSEFDTEALDFATWLASCLRADVDDRRDMFEADLYGDEWVRAWLDGDGGDVEAVGEAIDELARVADLIDAREGAQEILGEVAHDLLKDLALDRELRDVTDEDTDPAQAYRDLAAALEDVPSEHEAAGLARWIDEDVRDPLARATVEGRGEPDPGAVDADLPVAGDLAALVDRAVEAAQTPSDAARERVAAAKAALEGGREGCRRLAAWAEDGYAHPDAHHLLTGVITPTGADADVPGARRVDTDTWAFDPDATDGTVVDSVPTTERATVLVDRNGHGARLHTPPSRTAGNGEPAPLVGLDATARRELWATALGEDVTLADIHDTPADRARFLREALDLRVIQAADRPRSYEGDPSTKDTDGDVALLEAIADEYTGIEAPRERGEEPVPVGKPAAVTTKGVRDLLEADPRLDDVVAEWENYGNLTGANDLGDYRLAGILGSQHYGDDAVERFCALRGREVDTDRDAGRGVDLEYGDDLADTYLQHMREDQTMQAILRFARGDSGATVVARTSALRGDLPVVGDAQVVDTWSDTATAIARAYRRLGDEFTARDVADTVDVGPRQVRRILAELVDAGYLSHVRGGDGTAKVYEPGEAPGAGEADLPDRGDAVASSTAPGRGSTNQYYTWNVRVHGGDTGDSPRHTARLTADRRAPPSPAALEGVGPPG